ncbi:MAG TPA: cytochrome c oxidase assembly protein [Arenibaculum sp.]|nr:cytochrome c oxidase assembly protein [Arenibaculum sp.]
MRMLVPVLAACLVPGRALAHGFALIGPQDLWAAWTVDPWIVVPLLAVHWLYGRGIARMWRRAGIGRGVSRARVAAFLGGEAALVLAFVWPFDALGETLFAAHMVQHMLLSVVAPPLLILGMPLSPVLWALPPNRRSNAATVLRMPGLARPLAVLTRPGIAAALQAAALWGWHAPGAFEAARFDGAVHALEHASFLGTGLLFWWAVIHSGRHGSMGHALAAFWTLATVITGGLLGALITFAPNQLYPSYGDAAALWGMSALDDQQLAGLIMWVPAGLTHLAAGVLLVGAWLRALGRNGRMA